MAGAIKPTIAKRNVSFLFNLEKSKFLIVNLFASNPFNSPNFN